MSTHNEYFLEEIREIYILLFSRYASNEYPQLLF